MTIEEKTQVICCINRAAQDLEFVRQNLDEIIEPEDAPKGLAKIYGKICALQREIKSYENKFKSL